MQTMKTTVVGIRKADGNLTKPIRKQQKYFVTTLPEVFVKVDMWIQCVLQ